MRKWLIIFNPWMIVFVTLVGFILASFIIFSQPITQWVETSTYSLKHPLFISLFVITTLIIDVLLPIPSSIINVFAGTSLGIVYGSMAIWVGLSLGCCFGYYLGHASGVVMLPRYINSKDAQKAHQLCDKLGSGLLILMRAVPVLAEASVISAGMVGMPFVRFVVVTSLANIGLAISYAYIGTMALSSQSFLLVFVGAVAVPVTSWVLLIMLEKIVRLFRQTISVNFNEKALKRNIIHAEFAVNYTYPVLFTENVFNPANTCLRDVMVKANVNIKKQKVINALVFIDEGLYQNVPDLPSNVEKYFQSHRAVINLVGKNVLVPGGEVAKSSTQIDITQYAMLNCDLDRHAFVIIIGGGSVLDAVGYAAATFHRGVKVIRLPSTVLAQNDAGIGVKNGINAHGIKNLIGSFTPPHAVINDSVWLTTLSERDSRAGLAEAVKVAAIKDPAFFEWLEQHAHELAAFETESMHYMIYRCAELHLEQISRGGDPFEKGNARPLDYGHWCAHKLESLSDYELKHGEAVAIGMALDARYACNMGMLEEAESLRLIHLLQRLGFNLWHEALDIVSEDGQAMILQGLDEFRQHLGGTLSITQLTSMGEAIEVNKIQSETMLVSKEWLKVYESGYSL